MKKRILLFLILVVSLFTLTSCGGFFAEETKEIFEITSYVDQTGTTILRITYTDETKDEFKIPKGVEGNGIKEIKTTKNDKGNITTVTVIYTDETMEPVTFDVKDGVSITGVISRTNEETGEIYLVVLYSDDTESEPFLLPKGEKGDDGNGFTGFDKEENEDGSQTYYFHFSQSEDVVITIPAPEKGDTGRGIKSIIGTEEEGLYVLTINYSDETSEQVMFNKPKDPNAWLSGGEAPDKTLGRNGDYYFDTAHKVIYAKENGSWIKIVSFDDSTDYYFINFDLNDKLDGGVEASMPSGSYLSYVVVRNTYFTDNGYGDIPIPTREGYKFVGWYRSKNVNATSGAFTDLTPILSDLTLYAQWEKID